MSGAQGLEAGKRAFLEEVADILEQLEESLLELEEATDDVELVSTVFRALHTIKGSGSMFGFARVSAFTHEVETVFDQVRSGRVAVTKELIDLTLQSRDIIRAMLDAETGGEEVSDAEAQQIVMGLRRFLPLLPKEPRVALALREFDQGREEALASSLTTWRTRFKPSCDIFASGCDPLFLLEDLRALGDCDIVALTDDIPRLAELDPEQFYIGWDILLTTTEGREAIEDVFIFVGDDSELKIEVVEHHDMVDSEEAADKMLRLGDMLVKRGDMSSEELDESASSRKRLGELLVERGLLSQEKVDDALCEQEKLKKEVSKNRNRQKAIGDSSIRVASSKLDELVNLVGELVSVQARLSQIANVREDGQLLFLAEEVERLSSELRENTMNIRMVPIGSTFSKFKRLVRDLADALGREATLTTHGAETELDKTVIEKLHDPMVHLIRNALDHGIEPPDKRSDAGKNREGAIVLEARHSGAHVIIEIKDDGAGIDKADIRKKAVERGLMAPDEDISDNELYGLIFTPGFSTAQVVSNVSGRGVGLDVVRTNIEALRGSVELTSTEGAGTTVTLKIPLTLAIIEGLLTRVGEERYVVPLSVVEECVELVGKEGGISKKRDLIDIRGKPVPYIHLRTHFNIEGNRAEIEQIVVTEVEGQRIGFVVDEVIGQHQTVIKNLGTMYRNVKEISGTTILGDGTMALILDIAFLIRNAHENRLERN